MDRPESSIVIATLNENLHIEACLDSIFAAEPFGSFEVIVADGGSTDGTRQAVSDYAQRHPEVRLFDNPMRITPVGFNIGIKAARGDWIFILSAHSEYDKSYFRLCLETARCHGAANTGGWIEWIAPDESFSSRLSRAVASSPFGWGTASFRGNDPQEGPADAVAFGCFPRRVFEQYGLHDERLALNQDTELFWRLMKAGEIQWMNPAIRVRYHGRGSPALLIERAWRSGRWNAFMWWVAPYSVQAHHAIPGIFAASLLLPGLGVCSLVAHQAVAVVAAVKEAVKYKDPAVLPALPLMFLALHSAYGFGILKGFLDLASGHSPVQVPAQVDRLAPLSSGTKPVSCDGPGHGG